MSHTPSTPCPSEHPTNGLCKVCGGALENPWIEPELLTELFGTTVTIPRLWCEPGKGPIHTVNHYSSSAGRTYTYELNCYNKECDDISMRIVKASEEEKARRQALQPDQESDSKRARRIFRK